MKVIRQIRKGILMLMDLILNGFQHSLLWICFKNIIYEALLDGNHIAIDS
ncbi:unnamed protein product [Chironomus riparius]|uniref:Uncharacterized protein n=1 Tax=Chironomus riparius TaxID=315576 RepID=A0A9N9RWZ4_9DIPT|nr:unnamed protein product [Chironomus riparius]